MAKYRADFNALAGQADAFSALAGQLEDLENRLYRVSQSIQRGPSGAETLREGLKQCSRDTSLRVERARRARQVVRDAASAYAEGEKACTSLLEEYGLVDWNDAESGSTEIGHSSFEIIETEDGIKVVYDGVLMDYTEAVESDWFAYEMQAYLMQTHLDADFTAQLFCYDENGNLKLDPRINAHIGASIVMFAASAAGHIGNEYAQLYGNLDLEIGKVAAEMGASASLFDENGRFNPSGKISGELEAILLKAEAEAGINVLGVDAKAKGSFIVGAGAHFNAGFENGKFTFDAGAALGIGISVGFEIDFGGLFGVKSGPSESFLGKIFGSGGFPW